MTQKTQSVAPADTREQCYGLLSSRAPLRIVVDTDLKPGEWYVVRGEDRVERLARLAQEESRRLEAGEKAAQAAEEKR